MKSAIFLDRDGTIIIDRVYLNDPNKIEYLPMAIEGLKAMRNLGYKLIIVTNQSGIARGIVQIENLYAIHAKMRADLSQNGIDIAGFYYAPYSVESRHFLRKPNPGMLMEGARDFGIDLRSSWMIGDRLTDIEAGRAAQTETIYIQNSATQDPDVGKIPMPRFTVPNLLDAARIIAKFRK